MGLLQKARIQIWLFEQKDLRIEGRIIVRMLYPFSSVARFRALFSHFRFIALFANLLRGISPMLLHTSDFY